MIKRWTVQVALCIVTALPLVTGCEKPNPIVGKWQLSQDVGGTAMAFTREFKADGTEIMTGPSPGAMNAEMTYAATGNTLTENVTSMTVDGKTIKTDSSQMPANAPKYVTESFTLDGNTLTISNVINGIQTTQTYNRMAQ